MQDAKLARLCEEILAEAERLCADRRGREHDADLALWDHINKRDAQLAELFDDVRRSNAILKLMAWRRHGLLSPEEVSAFTPGTQKALSGI